ncbi:GGDEF domain-containing protein [Halalkalibacter okhensis]|uniref:C-di-GMP phosphodiesterase n=1 Tax=Halalkalibacter okhensis TaxID=333138 RepID=A0A0B0I875_9BACI|nr:GGDEF domain-containing protein [Halalkalibacter okhensis]KHF38698.1 c-di-GMP phosphodiesterase [Halalkalibacter okhensis]
MGYKGRLISVGIVSLFNILRYLYYHHYLGLRFEASFFILTAIFLSVAWWAGKQYDRAKYFSEKDPLTNTYNRRTVEQSFHKLIHKSNKHGKKLGLLLIDLDNFKEVNDSLGHQKGDELLTQVAFILKKISKKDDYIARWGGDEFIVLVPKVNENFATDYSMLLQEELTKLDLCQELTIGASIGAATCTVSSMSFEQMIQEADRAMYQMKVQK